MSSTKSPASGGSPNGTNGRLIYNWISLLGIALAIVAVMTGIIVGFSDALLDLHIPYVGVFYVLLAGLAAVGISVVGVGLWFEHRRRKTGMRTRLRLFTLDLNLSRHRAFALLALVLGIIGAAAGSGISYSGVSYMSSNEFCGNGCHSVMGPEGTAHQYTSHARVECVSCHVGPGAPSYIAAKMSGLRRLVGVVTGRYERPIPTPIVGMRPARETCETCHWKERAIGLKEKVYTHYETDEANTSHEVRLLIKIGGRRSGLMSGFGIHYHMQLSRTVELIARDRRKQDIPYVRVTDADGVVKEFNSSAKPLTDAEKQTLEPHRMDCLDCHNRPAHQFPTPMTVMNTLLDDGVVSPKIPYIKQKGVAALAGDYPTTAAALAGIDKSLRDYYSAEQATFVEKERVSLDQAIDAIKKAYTRGYFPEMNATYKTYVDNIGHLAYPGCFRCHNDDLKTTTGETIFTTCDKCHLVLAQDGEQTTPSFAEGRVFHHYGDDTDISSLTMCVDCHNGGPM